MPHCGCLHLMFLAGKEMDEMIGAGWCGSNLDDMIELRVVPNLVSVYMI